VAANGGWRAPKNSQTRRCFSPQNKRSYMTGADLMVDGGVGQG
jgi:hypothetical protein